MNNLFTAPSFLNRRNFKSAVIHEENYKLFFVLEISRFYPKPENLQSRSINDLDLLTPFPKYSESIQFSSTVCN